MPRRAARAALAALFLFPPLPLAAQSRPALAPPRDLAVTYRSAEGGELRLAHRAAERLTRLDLPGEQGWLVLGATGAGFLALPAQRLLRDVAPGQDSARGLLPAPGARAMREGADRVAGQPCTVWRVEDPGGPVRLCLTEAGVPLRAEPVGRPAARIEAVAFEEAPQDPARFRRPEGFATLPAPRAAPGPAGGLPRGTALPPPGLTLPGG
jgi:hypothetical protein